MSVEMATGVVKWFNDAKGFGFITQARPFGRAFSFPT
jgi:hypothetical protein